MVVLPDWLDQVPSVDFAPEKDLLTRPETWAQENGWIVSDGSSLPSELRRRTDVLFQRTDREQAIRLAVLPKSRNGAGEIRLDASSLRTIELVYRRPQRQWRVAVSGVPIADDPSQVGWDGLVDLMFRP
ncbi:MAG TPA: hypothetical protein VKT32_15600 [Chthonomonadaceae bacterium]|nr:hypothetical protein [Chthonomonadaceae bacterium]